MNITLIGVDLAKHSFAVCEVNQTGRVLTRHEFKRQTFAAYLAQLPAGTPVAMETCGSAHYWARKCQDLALFLASWPPNSSNRFAKVSRPRMTAMMPRPLLPPPDKAICGLSRARMPTSSWHRVREGHKQAKTAIGNRIRGLLAEFGVIVAQGEVALKLPLAELDERCHRIGQISGVGPLTADAAVATVGNGRIFKNGWQMAAWLGLVPKQATTGGHVKL